MKTSLAKPKNYQFKVKMHICKTIRARQCRKFENLRKKWMQGHSKSHKVYVHHIIKKSDWKKKFKSWFGKSILTCWHRGRSWQLPTKWFSDRETFVAEVSSRIRIRAATSWSPSTTFSVSGSTWLKFRPTTTFRRPERFRRRSRPVACKPPSLRPWHSVNCCCRRPSFLPEKLRYKTC